MSRYGFLAFMLSAPLLAVIFDFVLHKIWLEPAGIVPAGEQASYYFAVFLIVLITVLALSPFAFMARPVAIGFVSAILLGIYIAGTRTGISIQSSALIFIAQFIAVTFAVGLADGFVKGYRLRGVRGR